jgi:hypothetical protein
MRLSKDKLYVYMLLDYSNIFSYAQDYDRKNIMIEWCKNHINGGYDVHENSILFRCEQDKTMFLLRWA